MKTYKNLYPRICAFDNLLRAFRGAARGKRGKDSVADFEFHLEDNLLALKDELRSQNYSPGEYYNFRIHDPKPRLISAAPFRDRVVHHALCRVIEPLFERLISRDSGVPARSQRASSTFVVSAAGFNRTASPRVAAGESLG